MKFSLAQVTRIGARQINQDRLGSWRTSESLLLAVADGLGGHLRGEVAAEVAINILGAAFQREATPRIADPDAFLARAMAAGHAAILREGQRLNLPETPRTVVVACIVQEGYVHWNHIGDCRLYLFRNGRIVQRTRDHTVVQSLIDTGRIREEAASSHPERNRLLQALGGYQAPRPEAASRARLEKGDVLLLCSDGFWGPLTQRQMLHALMARPLGEAIPELVALAETRAGPQCDNVTVLALSWAEDKIAETQPMPIVTPGAAPQLTATDIRDFTATDPDFVHMSDEEIEKAIEELKEALRKSAPPQ
ncbi:MAG TPA: PP2C family serine/threonine-protein phosphatase [Burkholderiales bacterium]